MPGLCYEQGYKHDWVLKTTFDSSVLCDHLEGWDREGGREGDTRGKRYGDIGICITDSLCYKAETNHRKAIILQ